MTVYTAWQGSLAEVPRATTSRLALREIQGRHEPKKTETRKTEASERAIERTVEIERTVGSLRDDRASERIAAKQDLTQVASAAGGTPERWKNGVHAGLESALARANARARRSP